MTELQKVSRVALNIIDYFETRKGSDIINIDLIQDHPRCEAVMSLSISKLYTTEWKISVNCFGNITITSENQSIFLGNPSYAVDFITILENKNDTEKSI